MVQSSSIRRRIRDSPSGFCSTRSNTAIILPASRFGFKNPATNFLKKGIKTDEKNIELLAWLIDFRPRPYSKYQFGSGSNGEVAPALAIKEERTTRKEVILEYPSGVKLLVDASDFLLSRNW